MRRTYYPGWICRVDDGPDQPVLKVNGGLQGVRLVGSGTSRVTIRYRPNGLPQAARVSLAALALAALVLGIAGWKAVRDRTGTVHSLSTIKRHPPLRTPCRVVSTNPRRPRHASHRSTCISGHNEDRLITADTCSRLGTTYLDQFSANPEIASLDVSPRWSSPDKRKRFLLTRYSNSIESEQLSWWDRELHLS